MRLLVAIEPVDFRLGIDGLARRCRDLACDPFSGCLVVFRNKRATAIKALVYDGNGYWLCHKRLSQGRLCWWPSAQGDGNRGLRALDALQLQSLIWNASPSAGAPLWRSVTPPNA
jgi:hypothetical protein